MTTKLTCIECPKGCRLTIERKEGRIIKISGNQCEKGARYAHEEMENPTRVLTSCVLTEGLLLKMVPVRTDKPIPKEKLFEAMDEIKRIRLRRRVKAGDTVVENFLKLDVNLIVTRDIQ